MNLDENHEERAVPVTEHTVGSMTTVDSQSQEGLPS